MRLTDPYVLGGLVAIIIGLLVYFMMPAYSFPMYGLPMTTVVLVIVGLVMLFMGMRR
jgi:hypothetical protein